MTSTSESVATSSEAIASAVGVRDASLDQTALLSKETLESLPLDVTSIPRSSGLLSDLELDLTENHDATALLKELASNQVSSRTLLQAFRKRATIAQQCTNCITELLPGALQEAQACDDHLARTGKPLGPLHGLPVSVKEQIAVAGRCTNAGFVIWVNKVSEHDANIVTTLRNLGAVIFARTNQPQSLMHLETNNNIYGATVNPKNRKLTAGGSTGGEAALMAMHGTPLGIGGDIGGSIRLPAAYNGIYGFMPTPSRISGAGVVVATPGSDTIVGTLGTFTRSLRDLEMFCNAYSSDLAWIRDPSLVPADILNPSIGRQLNSAQPLRVGIMSSDGVVAPLPPVRHVLDQVQERLNRSSAVEIEVKTFKPLQHDRAWSLIAANYFEDGGANIRALCHEGGEPVLPMTEWILAEVEAAMKTVAPTHEGRKAARDAFRSAYADHWNEAGVDVVLAPVSPGTAPALGSIPYWGYTAVWNLLQYPAVSLPAASILDNWKGFDLESKVYEPENDAERMVYQHYSVTDSLGLPVGVQVVAPRLHESLLIKAVKMIEDALREA